MAPADRIREHVAYMTKRNIGKEIIKGLEEIKAWKRGEVKLRTFAVELPRAADVPQIRGAESEEEGLLQGTLNLEAFSFPESCVRRAEPCQRTL